MATASPECKGQSGANKLVPLLSMYQCRALYPSCPASAVGALKPVCIGIKVTCDTKGFLKVLTYSECYLRNLKQSKIYLLNKIVIVSIHSLTYFKWSGW